MAKGITIKVTRVQEWRERRPDEVRVRIWNGVKWVSPSATPYHPSMAQYCDGGKPKVVTTTISFLPPGVPSPDGELYKKTLLPEMRKMGVLR